MKQRFNISIDMQEIHQKLDQYLRQHWKFFAAEGVFFIILGLIAIIVPQVFAVGLALFLGWLLLAGGVVQLIRALSMMDMPGFGLWLFIGLIQALIGYALVMDPFKGAMTLTMLLTLFFAIEGLAKMYLAFMMRPLARWHWIAFSGFTSLLLAIVIWLGWPGTALWVLGLLLGINMLFLGWSLLKISLYHKTPD